MIRRVWPRPPVLRLPGEDTPAGGRQIVRELEPAFGVVAPVVVEMVIAVKAWLQAAGSRELTTPSDQRPGRRANPLNLPQPVTLPESLAALLAALLGAPDASVHLQRLVRSCHALARSAEQAGAPLAAFLFARLAWDAETQVASHPFYTFEMARLAAEVPGLAMSSREWLTWAALEGRRKEHWDVAALAVTSLAKQVAEDGDELTADRLQRVAGWAQARARSHAGRADTGGTG